MNLARRLCVALLSGLAVVSPLASGQSASVREVAITIDDPDLNADDTPLLSLDRRDAAIREALKREHLQAAIFVCGMRVDHPKGREHLLAWNRAGHLLGNHSYSHLYFPRAGFEQFSADVLRGESVIADLPQFRRLFRFPYLKEGATREQRDQMRAFLAAHGYRQGHVTIDTSDWAIDARLRKRLNMDSKANLDAYRQFYLDHIWARASYYDRLATEVLERPVKHTLLLHHNLLNALFLPDLFAMFKSKGWKLINASEALSDPVFSATPDIVPAGESIIWQLAKETGRFDGELRYPAEDAVYEEPKMNELGL
jgi:peptidoglycan/xylan/chitin deacetylase (PgdA/CDA1 family)